MMYSFPFKKKKIIYLAAPGLSCDSWDLWSLLQQAGSLVAAYKLLVMACRI